MRVSDILRSKGTDVVTVSPDTTVDAAAKLMADKRIGAVVLSWDGEACVGVVSERDIVLALARDGAGAGADTLASLADASPVTTAPDADVEEVMTAMTDRRTRHVPVILDGRIAGIVSIGDVVKLRLSQLELERAALEEYISRTR